MKLLIVIAFHYNSSKIADLGEIISCHPNITDEVVCNVITNTINPLELGAITRLDPKRENYTLEVISFPNLAHPWLLPWGHKQIMYEKFKDESYTHFLYIEDDIKFTKYNFEFWLKNINSIKTYGLYPSFVRVEFNKELKKWFMVDQTSRVDLRSIKIISESDRRLYFFNLTNPYQGLFLYDRDLMLEHINSYTFDINLFGRIDLIDHDPLWPGGGVAERANFALTYEAVPEGFTSRSAVCVVGNLNIIDPNSFVHHLPNKYTNLKKSPFGKISAFDFIDNPVLVFDKYD